MICFIAILLSTLCTYPLRTHNIIAFVVMSSITRSFIGHILCVCILSISCITKSSVFPFNSWLLRGMKGPTTVRSLVHSSALVISGLLVILIVISRCNMHTCTIVVLSSGISIIIRGMFTLVINDLKKTVGLSTINHIRFIRNMLLTDHQIYISQSYNCYTSTWCVKIILS
jgi:NADH:ubiquinone oxidoreductase subunit 5 (subunit L)/multisubunit Na+/H+ antiporter MnhA subunit